MTEDKLTENELTPEQKEARRAVALKNLNNSKIVDLASTYQVDASGAYGEAGNSAIEKYKYFPAMSSGPKFSIYNEEDGSEKEIDLMTNSILSSRQGGKRYSGNVSEYGIIESCAKIVGQSVGYLKVQDVLDLIGSGKKVKAQYQNKYLEDLGKSEDKEDKKLYQGLVESYMQYTTDLGVSESFKARTSAIKGGLEKALTE